jgi:lipoprotein-releasing system ATP-binding protein
MAQLKTQPRSSSAASPVALLNCAGVVKTFRMGDSRLEVLKKVDLSVRAGEFLAIEGRSGSGKSTLLHILGLLDNCDSGKVFYDGVDLLKQTAAQRSAIRNRQFGFVFQFYHLLPDLNVLENTLLVKMIEFSWLGYFAKRREIRQRAVEVLTSLGMAHRLKHRPSQLSGGERQRVAIARALMNQPRVLFADEPTGNLDAETGRQIMGVLEGLHRDHGQTIIMVTHDRSLAHRADRTLVLRDGALQTADTSN